MANSERLNAIKSLVPCGTRLLDIGSDHGLLPYDLLVSRHISYAFVTDVNEGPLQHSRLQLSRFYKEGGAANGSKVDFALSDGFCKVPKGVYDLAAICGMGGELIAHIIAEGGDKAKCPLILQPMTMYDRLRAFLWDNGFTIEKELYPQEGKRTYLVMLVRYTGEQESYTVAETYLGKLCPQEEGFYSFARAVAAAAENRLRGALHSDNNDAAKREMAIIEAVQTLLKA